MPEQEEASPDVPRVKGFLIFNALLGTLVAVNVTLLWALYRAPKTVALYLLLPYVTYTKFWNPSELRGGSRWRRFSNHFGIFPILRQFLSLTIDPVPESLAKEGQCLLAVFPHGVASEYRMLMDGMLPNALPRISEKIHVLAASVLFAIPVVREMALWTGCVDARKSVAERLLKKGDSILVLPGGEAEQIRTAYGKERVYLKKRKGFLKLALRHGVPVVPVYVFGSSDYYHTSSLGYKTRLWLSKNLGICIPLARGYWGSPFCPLPVPTTIVFGAPIKLSVADPNAPTTEELDAAHLMFCNELTALFDKHKVRLGYGERSLEIL